MIEHLYIIPILLFSVIIHEIAHGWMALKLGDPTAKMMGRLTLNPIPHIDLVGSILVPAFSLLAAGSVFIAWAKPVPVNPANFSHFRRDDVLVSIAGPLSNILLAFVCSIAVILTGLLINGSGASPAVSDGLEFLFTMFRGGIVLNVVLAVFNIIPVPPLDGSHVLASVLPDEIAYRYSRIGFAGVFIVIFLMRVPFFSNLFSSIITTIMLPLREMINLFL